MPRRGTVLTAAALALAGLVLVAVGFALLDGTVAGGGVRTTDPPVATAEPPPAAVAPSASPRASAPLPAPPVAVEIPALGVSAPVLPVSAAGSVLTPPADVRLVGWWRDGAAPGAVRGTVLLAGHTSSRSDGVFDRLGRLERDDKVVVVTARGRIDYRVEDVATHDPARVAQLAPRLFSRTSKPRLVLVTCSGYDGSDYRTTTIVTAAMLGGAPHGDRGS